MKFTDGSIYFGEFVKELYDGEFVKGLYDGEGYFKEADGNYIRTNWEDNNVKGNYVEYRFNDGRIFNGSMNIHNMIMSSGKLSLPDGTYNGNFENGVFHGYGRMVTKNDENWSNGLNHGNGKRKDKTVIFMLEIGTLAKKRGKFKIDFKIKETLFISFDNDLSFGKGKLHLDAHLVSKANSSSS